LTKALKLDRIIMMLSRGGGVVPCEAHEKLWPRVATFCGKIP